MDDLDTREWLLTNGLGGFASGTVADARTRTYHGWLIAALDPPSQRTLLLSHLEASIEIASRVVALSTNFWGSGTVAPTGYQLLQSFAIKPVPTWVWGEDNWQLSRQMVMPYGLGERQEEPVHCGGSPRCSNWRARGERQKVKSTPQHPKPNIQHPFCNRILIQYRYEGSEVAILRLRPMIGDRDFHHQQQASDVQFSQIVGQQQIYLQALHGSQAGTPWQLRWTQGEYQAEPLWYWDYALPEETKRGLGDREDLYSPGCLTVTLQPGATVTVEATTQPDLQHPLNSFQFAQAVQAEQKRLADHIHLSHTKLQIGESPLCFPISLSPCPLWQQLLRAGDQFIVYRASIAKPTAIAGYHWFNDWGRDTLIALPGLALTTQRFDLAKELLQSFGSYCRYGLIPNTFPDAGAEPSYNSIDAALWWIETLGLYLEATQDWDFLVQQYPVVQQIYKAFTTGTKYNIHVDAVDGLIGWNAPNMALTWMDVVIDGEPVTPRRGKPVEINALWYSALCWASNWAERLSKNTSEAVRLSNQARRYAQQAQQVKTSLQKFWNPNRGYFYDTIEPDDRLNEQIRPNAVIALSLHHCGFPSNQARLVLQKAVNSLLTPYGLRSLAPDDREYIGNYAGDPQHRDRAYHQGTVWSWLIGAFIRAWQRFYPSEPIPFDSTPLMTHFLSEACIGSISEIFDGDPPHAAQGAIAQAWSVAEVIRHWIEIKGDRLL